MFAGGIGVQVRFLFADLRVEDRLRTGLERSPPAGVANPTLAAVEANAWGFRVCRSSQRHWRSGK